MKHTVLIFILFCSRLFCQVSAPDLRCLEVLPNYNVLLTWISPPDPSHSFNSYEVYFSVNQTGPYALAGTVTSVGTNTFLHTAIGTSSANSIYYYVSTKSGPGGINSANSQTLQTMHLNILAPAGSVDLKIQYNNVHSPALNSTSTTYTINKEYPIGTWNVIGVIPGDNYADTISVCHTRINYQITLKDNQGCVSKSNIIFGNYTDTYRPGGPNGPFVDSISVLPDGRTIIAWRIPRDMDIVKYKIYLRVTEGGIVSEQDYANGRPTTSYIYTVTTANSQPLSLFVAAVDSCSDAPGLHNVSPITMHLNADYDQCLYQTKLHWNPYQGMPDGILEYRVYYTSDNVHFIQIGSTQDTSFVHKGTSAGKNVCYYVRVFNNSKTISASSNRACFFTTQVLSSSFVYIRSASVVDKKSVQLRVLFDTTGRAQGLDVYRSTNGTSYSHIGFATSVLQPQFAFTDDAASTQSQSYYYKIVVKDACGNPRATSNVCRTMLLKVGENSSEFSKNLDWNAYEGFSGGIKRYEVYRIINDMPATTPLGITASDKTTFTDDIEDAAWQGSKIEYMVRAIEGAGNAYGIFETSDSNPAEVYMDGNLYIPNAFAPNGHNKTWKPITYFIDKTDYSVTVFNRWGAKVFDTTRDDVAWDGQDCIPDVYVYLVRYKTATGEYKEAKGTVLLLE